MGFATFEQEGISSGGDLIVDVFDRSVGFFRSGRRGRVGRDGERRSERGGKVEAERGGVHESVESQVRRSRDKGFLWR